MIETNTIVRTGMKVVTQRDELAQKLGVVARAVSTRASVQILSSPADYPPHDGELVFGFVLEGQAELGFEGSHLLEPADAFVIPPGQPWQITAASPDLRLLHVTTARLG